MSDSLSWHVLPYELQRKPPFSFPSEKTLQDVKTVSISLIKSLSHAGASFIFFITQTIKKGIMSLTAGIAFVSTPRIGCGSLALLAC